jgi:Zn finger protein HypA/HybF involved in hydrogenase expression
MQCDYPKCLHEGTFRKDHCRAHYRKYHNEDLLNQSRQSTEKDKPKKEKPKKEKESKRSQDKPETVEEFLASRRNINLSWWRCYKCIKRVNVETDKYMCPRCIVPCEPERVAWRQTLAEKNSQSTSAYVTGCGECENMWLPDENDSGLWVSCPKCRPGVEETMRF